jgi:hypothetical protein
MRSKTPAETLPAGTSSNLRMLDDINTAAEYRRWFRRQRRSE